MYTGAVGDDMPARMNEIMSDNVREDQRDKSTCRCRLAGGRAWGGGRSRLVPGTSEYENHRVPLRYVAGSENVCLTSQATDWVRLDLVPVLITVSPSLPASSVSSFFAASLPALWAGGDEASDTDE
jgi:hypothetical protein